MPALWSRITRYAGRIADGLSVCLLFLVLLAGDALHPAPDIPSQLQPYIRKIEFDFIGWTLDAIGVKVGEASLGTEAYLNSAARARLVRDYFDLIHRQEDLEGQIANRYADPAIADKAAATVDLRADLDALRVQARTRQPLAEAILQEQIAVSLAEQGLALGGQPTPPVAFHFTQLPMALVVSPRDKIEQVANLPIQGDLPLADQVALEDQITREQNLSALCVGLGGIGTYPTMIMRSSYFSWIVSVGAHEWAHNYFTLHPLGINYETSPALRTMNETAAEVVGNEIGALVLQRYYPDLAPPVAPYPNQLVRTLATPEAPAAPPEFDFRAEMHATRVRADELLAAGKIDEAEAYMETRRQFFWGHGYQIRKLNQAYFAFYGAYAADAGGGAQGVDPVGPAVLLLRRRSPTLKAFVDTLVNLTTFEQLQQVLEIR